MKQDRLLINLALLLSFSFSQSDFASKATSVFSLEELTSDNYQGIKYSATNVTYHWAIGWEPKIVIRETVNISTQTSIEGSESLVLLEAFDISDTSLKLWEILNIGEKIEYRWNNFLIITKFDCCGASNAKNIYSLSSGEKLITYTSDLLHIRLWPNIFRLAGVTGNTYEIKSVFPKVGNNNFLFTYASENSPIEQILVEYPDDNDMYIWPPDSIYIIGPTGKHFSDYVDFSNPSFRHNKPAINNSVIVLEFSEECYFKFRIYNDNIDLNESVWPIDTKVYKHK